MINSAILSPFCFPIFYEWQYISPQLAHYGNHCLRSTDHAYCHSVSAFGRADGK